MATFEILYQEAAKWKSSKPWCLSVDKLFGAELHTTHKLPSLSKPSAGETRVMGYPTNGHVGTAKSMLLSFSCNERSQRIPTNFSLTCTITDIEWIWSIISKIAWTQFNTQASAQLRSQLRNISIRQALEYRSNVKYEPNLFFFLFCLSFYIQATQPVHKRFAM